MGFWGIRGDTQGQLPAKAESLNCTFWGVRVLYPASTAQGLLLLGFWGTDEVLGIEPRWDVSKANVLPTVPRPVCLI